MNEPSSAATSQALVLPGVSQLAYEPIDSENGEIRVAELLPGQYNHPVELRLHTKNLDDRPDYEALSYAWGKTMSPRRALLNGCPLHITESLDLGLRRLRFVDRSRILWVDALCINQGDIQERSQQVQHMAMIYSSAREVLIWLGEWPRSSRCPDSETCQTTWSWRQERVDGDPHWFHFMDHFLDILKRPWFHRVWVIQEVVLARHEQIVHVGSHTIRWSELLDVSKSCINKDPIVPPKDLDFRLGLAGGNLGRLESMRRRTVVGTGLTFYRCASESFEATDKRDKVYGLLGICKFEGVDRIIPDYSKTLTQVLAQATMVSIMERTPKHYLDHLRRPRGRPIEFSQPTWIVESESHECHHHAGSECYLSVTERDRLKHLVSLSKDGTTLLTVGRHIDTIRAVMPGPRAYPKSGVHPPTAVVGPRLYRFYHKVLRPAGITVEQFREVFYMYFPKRTRSAYYIRKEASVANFIAHLLKDEVSFSKDYTLRDELDEIGLYVGQLLLTEQRHLTVPFQDTNVDAEVGDVLVNLFGYNIPFILRPLKGDSTYQMIGIAQLTHMDRLDWSWIKFEGKFGERWAIV